MILLDTNVVSELVSSRPAWQVLRWLDQIPAAQVYVSSVTLGECLYGTACLPQGQRRLRLEEAYTQLFGQLFDGRVLAYDGAAATCFAHLAAAAFKSGYNVKLADLQIASIALANHVSLATRDVDDFRHEGLVVVNPWAGEDFSAL